MYFKSRLSQSLGLTCILSAYPYKEPKIPNSVVLVHCSKISLKALHIGITVLISSGLEIIFLVAGTVLQFGFSMRLLHTDVLAVAK